jgi:hypothetical protein
VILGDNFVSALTAKGGAMSQVELTAASRPTSLKSVSLSQSFATSQGKDGPPRPGAGIRYALDAFCENMFLLWEYLEATGSILQRSRDVNIVELASLLSSIYARSRNDSRPKPYGVNLDLVTMMDGKEKARNLKFEFADVRDADTVNNYVRRIELGIDTTQRSMLQQFVNSFEHLLGGCYIGLLSEVPEHSQSATCQIELSKLLGSKSLDEARASAIDAILRTFLARSVEERVKDLSDLTGRKIAKECDSFVSACESVRRRHLLVHADGRITEEFRQWCANNSVKLDPQAVWIDLSKSYLLTAWQSLFLLGFSAAFACLGHVVHKNNGNKQLVDESLNGVAYRCLVNKKYELVIKILKPRVDQKFVNDDTRMNVILNLAQALRWSGDEAGCGEVLKKVQWKSMHAKFHVCSACLLEQWDIVERKLPALISERDIAISELFDWPIFTKLREKRDLFSKILEVATGLGELPKPYRRPKIVRLDAINEAVFSAMLTAACSAIDECSVVDPASAAAETSPAPNGGDSGTTGSESVK